MPIRVRLEEDDFKALVQGEVVMLKDHLSGREVEVMLADIGFGPMEDALDEAIDLAACAARERNGIVPP